MTNMLAIFAAAPPTTVWDSSSASSTECSTGRPTQKHNHHLPDIQPTPTAHTLATLQTTVRQQRWVTILALQFVVRSRCHVILNSCSKYNHILLFINGMRCLDNKNVKYYVCVLSTGQVFSQKMGQSAGRLTPTCRWVNFPKTGGGFRQVWFFTWFFNT